MRAESGNSQTNSELSCTQSKLVQGCQKSDFLFLNYFPNYFPNYFQIKRTAKGKATKQSTIGASMSAIRGPAYSRLSMPIARAY